LFTCTHRYRSIYGEFDLFDCWNFFALFCYHIYVCSVTTVPLLFLGVTDLFVTVRVFCVLLNPDSWVLRSLRYVTLLLIYRCLYQISFYSRSHFGCSVPVDFDLLTVLPIEANCSAGRRCCRTFMMPLMTVQFHSVTFIVVLGIHTHLPHTH